MGFLHDTYAERGRSITERNSVFIASDKAPYYSPLDRTVVEGRTAHREHMKRHGVVEAGDMKIGNGSTERSPMDPVRHDVRRAIQELNR